MPATPLFTRPLRPALAALMLLLAAHGTAAAVDEEAAQALAKKGNCFKCHSVEKRKKAPAYAEVAAKYKGRADAEAALYRHITGNPQVKVENSDELHEPPPTKDEAELRNLIQWILSR